MAEVVVWSARIARLIMPARARVSPYPAERTSPSLPTQQNTKLAYRAASQGLGALAPLYSLTHCSALAGAAEDGLVVIAVLREVARHGMAHDARSDERNSRHMRASRLEKIAIW
jgi:hypothetical protein